MKLARNPATQAVSTNTLGRFETEDLVTEENLRGLEQLDAQWVDRAIARTPHRRVTLVMDSSENSVYRGQEGAVYNGHFETACYHPLFLFIEFGDCEGAMLRTGNVHMPFYRSNAPAAMKLQINPCRKPPQYLASG